MASISFNPLAGARVVGGRDGSGEFIPDYRGSWRGRKPSPDLYSNFKAAMAFITC